MTQKPLPHPMPTPPGPGQESVWDYPRPAIAERADRTIRIEFAGRTLAETRAAVRTLETSHPPSYYIPPEDFDGSALAPIGQRTLCEWKGQARYYDVVVGGRRAPAAAWSYDAPTPTFAMLAGFVTVYPALMDACFVDGERVTPQPGGFYGGWITSHVVGPFKGPPGTRHW